MQVTATTDLEPRILVGWAEDIARFMLEEQEPRRWKHTLGVAREAKKLGEKLSAEEQDTLVAAAYVHDIGYSAEIANTGFHPLDGARYLRELGQERLAGLTAYHSGAIYEARLRGLEGELSEFVRENTETECLLTCCDLSTSPDGESVSIEERLADVLNRYGPNHIVHQAVTAARPEFEAMRERLFKDDLRGGLIWWSQPGTGRLMTSLSDDERGTADE